MTYFEIYEKENIEKIKQLEQENQILRKKLLNELTNHIEENTKLKLKIENLQRELLLTKQHNAMLELRLS